MTDELYFWLVENSEDNGRTLAQTVRFLLEQVQTHGIGS
jgi:hypothetical protein